MDLLQIGTPVLTVHRRLFTDDTTRFFIGTVEAYENGVARVVGYTWIRDPHSGARYARKADLRTKIIPVASGTLMLYALPASTDPETLRLEAEGERLLLRDGSGFEMDLSERVPT